MKLPKSDIGLLFSTPRQVAEPAAARVEHVSQDAVRQTTQLPLVKQLKAALPHLWRKVEAPRLTKKEQRAELLRLLAWLCSKRGWQFAEQHPQTYSGKSGRVAGRLQAWVAHGQEQVAIELLFELDASSLSKLRAAHQAGQSAMLVWAGAACSRSDLLARASAQLAGAAVHWLDVLTLAAD